MAVENIDFVHLIRDLGFPTFFCLWMMLRMEKRHDEQTKALQKLVLYNKIIAKTLDIEDEEDGG